jgi:hypothetical protein
MISASASFTLLNQEGNPFQEILNELSDAEVPTYESYLKERQYDSFAPKDAAARKALLEIVDRATERLKERAEVLCRLAKLDADSAADRLSWDDTAEGERVRRYELSCERTWSRMFDLLLKIRTRGDELDIATVESLSRSVANVASGAIDRPAPFDASVTTLHDEPVNRPDPPIEAKLAAEKAPNEANSDVQAPREQRQDEHKEHRIDTPHLDRKPGGIGITANTKSHQVLSGYWQARGRCS